MMIFTSTLRRLRLRYLPQQLRTASKTTLLACCVSLVIILIIHQVAFHQDRRVTLAIVEEHHEVLPYWFESADLGEIPTSGLTLIHIDGHPDESTPDYIPGIPFFRYPKEEEEVQVLMQRNDVFIQAAVMSGLISKVIWIWPSWDKKEKDMDVQEDVSLGYTVIKRKSVREPHFCWCQMEAVSSEQRSRSEKKELRCRYLSYALDLRGQDPEVPLEAKKCKLSKMYTSVHLNEGVALKKLEMGGLIKKGENVILDIDEDFFGCESGMEILNKNGVSWRIVDLLNRKLKLLFCPHFIKHENAADVLLKDTIKLFLKTCSWDDTLQGCTNSRQELVETTYEPILKTFQTMPSLFCSHDDSDLKNRWTDVVEVLTYMNPSHLLGLIDLGFCLSTSPATLGFEEEDDAGIQICHGKNTPNETVVYLHTPTEREIIHRMNILNDLLKLIKKVSPPKLITICRSVRDGYTPRNLSATIEAGILKAVMGEENNINPNYKTVYDVNLLGGTEGWKGRYKPQ